MKIDSLSAMKIIFLFMTMGVSMIMLIHPQGLSMSKLLITLSMIISINLILLFFFKNLIYFKSIHLYFKIMLLLLFMWILFTIGRSINSNPKDLIVLFANNQVGALSWMTPFAIVFGFNVLSWLFFFKNISIFLVVGILISILSLFITDVAYSAKVWLLFFPMMLFTYTYHKRSTQKIIILSIVMYFIISIIISERSNLILIFFVFIFFIFEYMRNIDVSMYKKITLTIILSLSILFGSLVINDYINKLKNNKEASVDTRTFLFVEINKDMNDMEKILGRGVLGTYYSPYFSMLNRHGNKGGDSANRSTNEVGYLFIMLKGGYIMIILYLLILLPAVYLGIFRSNNIIAKASGYYILTYLLMWTVSYPPEFLPKFIILWMAAGSIIYKPLRELENEKLLTLETGRKVFANNTK